MRVVDLHHDVVDPDAVADRPDRRIVRGQQALKENAARNRRSINSEAITCLEAVLQGKRMDPREFLAHVDARRKRTPGMYITEEFLRAAKDEGRP